MAMGGGQKTIKTWTSYMYGPLPLDVILAVTYFSDGYYAYGTATAALAFVPTVAVQV